MRIAIIDDLEASRENLCSCLSQYWREHYVQETPTVTEFTSGEGFLAHFTPEAWDIVFIDQYMSGLSGIETAQKIRETDKLVPLVFVTSSESHAIESYGVRACGYLVKPYDYESFEKAMNLSGLEKMREVRFVRIEQEKILLRKILWCDRDKHYIQIHVDGGNVLRFRITLQRLTELLTPYPQFLTCYKGCIVNAERVECIEGSFFLLDTELRIPFAPREKKRLEALLSAYLFQREREDALL